MVLTSSPGRARSIEGFVELGSKFVTDEGYELGLRFRPRPSDLIISTYPKSGTTWLQQIAHGLRTRGSMDFEEIAQVSPWIEMASDLDWDLDAEQPGDTRLFKAHLSWDDVPKGGRYICAFRNPLDVVVSYYRFFEGWWFEPGSIDLDDMTRALFINAPEAFGYWHHLISWWEQRENENVLLICYEDMLGDLTATVRTVANFMGIVLDGELLDIVVTQSSKAFMLANTSKFDEHLIQAHFERQGGAPMGHNTSKVTDGTQGRERYEMSQPVKEELDGIWKRTVGERLGFEDYEAFRTALSGLPHQGLSVEPVSKG